METIQFRINKNLIIGILSFLVGVLLAYVVFTLIADKPKVVGQQNQPILDDGGFDGPYEQSDSAFISPSTTNADENIFTSKILGLSFSYLKYGYSFDENDHGIIRSVTVNPPTISGNKILFGPDYASSMTVYDKQPTQSLEAAITSQFLQGIPATQCLPVRVMSGSDTAYYTPGNGISYVVLRSVTPNGCPTQFNFSNPSAAFVSFSNQPNKFLYVVGGADGMMPLLTSNGDPFWVTMKFNSN